MSGEARFLPWVDRRPTFRRRGRSLDQSEGATIFEWAVIAGVAILVSVFFLGTSAGRKAFVASMGFFVGSVMVLSAAGTIASAVLLVLLVEPSLQPVLAAVAPWYTLLSLVFTVFVGFVAAVRAVRVG